MLGTVAEVVRAFFYEPFRTPGAAMAPTLIPGDHFYVNKRAYVDSDPRRGDIIVFRVPPAGSDEGEQRVMRVVAIAGDRIEIVDGFVRLNGEMLSESETGETYVDGKGSEFPVRVQVLGEHAFHIVRTGRSVSLRTAHTVPEGHYYVLGDNRDNSRDSRYHGVVPRSNLVGRVNYIYFSSSSDSFGPRWSEPDAPAASAGVESQRAGAPG